MLPTFIYDQFGRVKEELAINGVKTTFSYDLGFGEDLTGLPLRIKTGDHSETYEYDVMGRSTEMTNHFGYPTVFTYDKIGRQVTFTEGEGGKKHVTTNVYDEQHRLVKSFDKVAGEERASITKYDQYGETVSSTNPLGHSRQILKRDNRGHVLEVREPDGALYRVESFDPLGRPNGMIYPTVERLGTQGRFQTEEMHDLVKTYNDVPRTHRNTGQKVTSVKYQWGPNRVVTEFWSLRGELVAKETLEDGRLQKIVNHYSQRSELLQVDRYEGNANIAEGATTHS